MLSKALVEKRTLFPELGLSLLYTGNEHVTNTSIRESIEAGTDAVGFDHVEGFRARVVRAIDHGTNGKTESHTELVARGTST